MKLVYILHFKIKNEQNDLKKIMKNMVFML